MDKFITSSRAGAITGQKTKMVPGLLNGKVAIITGSSQGIGKATAKIFVEQGAKVVINGRNPEPCNQLAKEFNNNNCVEALSHPADVTKYDEVQKMIDQTIETFGKIDIVVNNVGTSRDSLIHKMTDKLLRFIIDLNIKGTHNVIRAVLPHLLEEKRKDEFKKIINFASSTGISGNVGQTNYAMAKGGIIAYSKSLSRELSLYRVNVNVVAPGFTHTRMTDVKTDPKAEIGMPESVRSLAISATPFSRNGMAGQPHHNGNVVLFFASHLSDWITGQVILVDGGLYI